MNNTKLKMLTILFTMITALVISISIEYRKSREKCVDNSMKTDEYKRINKMNTLVK